jgi:mycothiol system anti-sigma-R factor
VCASLVIPHAVFSPFAPASRVTPSDTPPSASIDVTDSDAPSTEACAGFQESSFAWCDGELNASEREVIAAHLTECEPCRQSFAADSVFRSAVRNAATTDRAPETLRHRVMTLLEITAITATSA